GIDPVFGAILNPTGGLPGPGNISTNVGDTIGYHGIAHDAAGYLYNYHNVGPGYDYLGKGDFPASGLGTESPISGQRAGIIYWATVLPPEQVSRELFQIAGALFLFTVGGDLYDTAHSLYDIFHDYVKVAEGLA